MRTCLTRARVSFDVATTQQRNETSQNFPQIVIVIVEMMGGDHWLAAPSVNTLAIQGVDTGCKNLNITVFTPTKAIPLLVGINTYQSNTFFDRF